MMWLREERDKSQERVERDTEGWEERKEMGGGIEELIREEQGNKAEGGIVPAVQMYLVHCTYTWVYSYCDGQICHQEAECCFSNSTSLSDTLASLQRLGFVMRSELPFVAPSPKIFTSCNLPLCWSLLLQTPRLIASALDSD